VVDLVNVADTRPAAGALRLARHSFFNLAGQGGPFLAALFAVPLLIRGLGTDRFGVLTLAWLVVGYFSLFDMGLSRALTQIVAEKLGENRPTQALSAAWTALGIMFGLGLVGTAVVGLLSPWLVHSVLRIPASLQSETLRSFVLLAAAIPVMLVAAGLAGILTAFHRFGTLNAIRGPVGIYILVAPLAVLPFTRSLVAVTAVLVLGRILACGVYLLACRRLMPPLRTGLSQPFAAVRPLFRFGVWMTVTNVVSPLMVYLDRFIIGATVSVAAVAYYSTPLEVITKVLIVPGALLGVLFPAFAASHRQDRERLVRLFGRGTAYVALFLFPVLLLVTAFAHEGLRLWLGDEFARHGAPVLQWLAVGVFINGIAQVFATYIQGIGRPDLTATLHLIELPIYLPLLWWAIHQFGIVGAAIAWTGRVALDGALLFWLSGRLLGQQGLLMKRMGGGLLAALGALAAPLLVGGVVPRALLVSALLAVFAWLAWFVVLGPGERASIGGWRKRLAGEA
jgi:O-antigen/teichoic acid export membrane protein